MEVINLGLMQREGRVTFIHRKDGEDARDWFNLDSLDYASGYVEVKIPEETLCMTTSFFDAMFGPSIQALGRDGFEGQYRFVGRVSVVEMVKRDSYMHYEHMERIRARNVQD